MTKDNFNKIIYGLKSGKTLCIATHIRILKISEKHVKQYKKQGIELLKRGNDSESGFYVARGKRYDYVMPGGCSVYFETH